ncbi:organic solute transporter Ostalpha-domain-containing protein [Xylogone sp. PMI_703]|nr:organic solute transporter Ostalpha-domain-containing protein [Xylogone sp. PMI_703]
MGIFHRDSSQNHTCPVKTLANPEQVKYSNGMSFHEIAVIAAGALTAFTCIISIFSIMKHATHYSVPREQKHLIRIISVVPVYAIISFLGVAFEDASKYITPVGTFYEACCFASLFMLLLEFLHEDHYARQEFFMNKGTLKKYTSMNFMVFQFPIVSFGILVATDITQAVGVFCEQSNKPYFAHIWITIASILTTSLAVMSMLRFYKLTKKELAHRKPGTKFFAFKAIVFVNFLQTTIFTFLISGGDLKPTSHYTYNDITIAVPNLLSTAEMVIFALTFLYVFRTSEYIIGKGSAIPGKEARYMGGPLGYMAILQALDIRDVIYSMVEAPARLFGERKHRADVYGV